MIISKFKSERVFSLCYRIKKSSSDMVTFLKAILAAVNSRTIPKDLRNANPICCMQVGNKLSLKEKQ